MVEVNEEQGQEQGQEHEHEQEESNSMAAPSLEAVEAGDYNHHSGDAGKATWIVDRTSHWNGSTH